MNTDLTLISLSDIHLGNTRTTTAEMIKSLNNHVTNLDAMKGVDLMVFSGDVFDTNLFLSRGDYDEIHRWGARVIRICEQYGITLVFLEGTPSHDHGQSKMFIELATSMESKVDIRYIKTLAIERFDRYDIDVLFVPDEYRSNTEDTYREVLDLLARHQLDKVDFAFMHGMFSYQVPDLAANHLKHNEESYLRIVRNLIYIGHVHQASQYERIFSNGSYDRISHGDEGPKGYYRCTVRPDGTYAQKFIENKSAKIYVTIKCDRQDIEDSLRYIYKKTESHPEGSYIRLDVKPDSPIVQALPQIKRTWPNFHFDLLIRQAKDVKLRTVEEEKIDYTPIVITPVTIAELVSSRIIANGIGSDIHFNAMEKLKELI